MRNHLPWLQIEVDPNQTLNKLLQIRQSKEMVAKFLDGVPTEIKGQVKQVLKLKYDEEPDYDGLILALKRYFAKMEAIQMEAIEMKAIEVGAIKSPESDA